MSPVRRGLRDIRTLTGRVGQVTAPYQAYMRISHIELEKAQRSRERQAARALIANIDGRLQEIEQEKLRILEALKKGRVEEAPTGFRRLGPGRSFRIRY